MRSARRARPLTGGPDTGEHNPETGKQDGAPWGLREGGGASLLSGDTASGGEEKVLEADGGDGCEGPGKYLKMVKGGNAPFCVV